MVRKLLFGEYTSGAELEEELKSVDITLEGDAYCAAVIQIRSSVMSKDLEQWNELRLFIREHTGADLHLQDLL